MYPLLPQQLLDLIHFVFERLHLVGSAAQNYLVSPIAAKNDVTHSITLSSTHIIDCKPDQSKETWQSSALFYEIMQSIICRAENVSGVRLRGMHESQVIRRTTEAGSVWGPGNGPRTDADISLNPHDPLLMQYCVRLTNDLVYSVPRAFCLYANRDHPGRKFVSPCHASTINQKEKRRNEGLGKARRIRMVTQLLS
ncbi:hypothetical protein BDW62DRAFT_51728 [Aspergillus aurantiobrunneus]